MLREYMERAGVEGKEELWRLFGERAPLIFEREPFELCYEGIWSSPHPFFLALEYTIGTTREDSRRLGDAYLDRNEATDWCTPDEKLAEIEEKWEGRRA
jgi:hypothetical protein